MGRILPLAVLFFLLLFASIGKPVQAKPLIADLAIRSITIHHDFTGIDILLFGAQLDVGQLVVVVRGPEQTYLIRRKERVAGIWTNHQNVTISNAPAFYSLAATRPLERIRNESLLETLHIGVINVPMELSEAMKPGESALFQEAFLRKKQESGLYSSSVSPVTYWGETLFRVPIHFPKTISQGTYNVEVYLFRDGQLMAMQTTPMVVKTAGIEAFLYDTAHHHALFYGLACVLMALGLGWLASTMFRKV